MKTTTLLSLVLASVFSAFPSHAAKSDYVGQAYFRKGDSIEITSVDRSKDSITVKGHYDLVSAESATLSLYITFPNGSLRSPTDPTQTMRLSKPRCDFQL